MSAAILVRATGGPEVLKLEQVEVGAPGPGEARIRQSAAGVNFIDVYYRNGLYPTALPFIPGNAAVGRVEAVGEGVSHIKAGDKIAYGDSGSGGYAEERLIKADNLIRMPEGLDDAAVAGMMLRGLTVWYLVRALHKLQPGETVLFHAAAGGVGLVFCEWAKHIGATVIGTVGTPQKAEIAKAAGCDHVIQYRSEDWVKKVREITGGKGVPVVYDGVGKDTFTGSLDCLSPRGLMVSFGNASGPAAPIGPGELASRGSLFLTRPRMFDWISDVETRQTAGGEFFDLMTRGVISPSAGPSFPLADAAEAHRQLESRATTGSTVLVI